MDRAPEPNEDAGGWAGLYLLVCIAALLVMAALRWFTVTYDIPMGPQ